MIKAGGNEMIKSVTNIVNEVDSQMLIPFEWQQMEIKSIHKKGSKMDLNNKRGLFLTSNLSKVYEKLVKKRNQELFEAGISPWQTGGVRGRSTTDNILITTAVIEMNQYLNKESYSVYTDAEKCFDLLDLNDGVVELWRCGTDVRDCIMIKRLNERARIKVITPVGETDFFELENIVRQGTVYGPQICIAVMDRINFTGDDIVTMYSPDLELRAPTFVDDVMNTGSLRSANSLIYNCSIQEERKKMTFSTKNGKTEYIYIKGKKGKVNPKTISNKVKTGHIQRVQEHKALGTWFKEDGLLNAEIENKKAKLPLMISTTKKQASPSNLGILAVEGRLKLIETVVIPSILHNLEAQQSISQKHLDVLERIQLNLLTEILEIPRTTPYLPLLIETGFLKMEARLAYNRLMLYHNLLKSDDKRVAKLVMEEQEKLRRDSTWKTTIDKELSKYNIDLDPKETSKSVWKKYIKEKIKNQNTKEVTENCKEKTKTRFVKNDQYKLKSYLREVPLK